ncbi:MAG TPA: hypothetical protein VJN88_14395 [Ktedonobacterales bacterium]|nr:hypothetical protein [Ktedonobacterales bacterium]
MPGDEVTELSRIHGFRPEALDANRAGLLAPEQVSAIRLRATGAAMLALGLGLVCLILGGVGLVSPRAFGGHAPFGATGAGAVAALAFGIFLLALGFRFVLRLPSDLAGRRVASVEGFISKFTRTESGSEGSSVISYHYRIKSLAWSVSRAAYERLDSRLRYRVYYLPRTKLVVNIEPIAAPLGGSGGQGMYGVGDAIPRMSSAMGHGPLPSAEEVSAILGEPFQEAPADAGHDPLQARGAVAVYQNASRTRTVRIQVVLGADDLPMAKAALRRLATMGQAVPGLGDEAHYLGGSLMVRRGDSYLFVTVGQQRQRNRWPGQSSPEQLEEQRKLAELALGRLG